jgi:hypothetical protein
LKYSAATLKFFPEGLGVTLVMVGTFLPFIPEPPPASSDMPQIHSTDCAYERADMSTRGIALIAKPILYDFTACPFLFIGKES